MGYWGSWGGWHDSSFMLPGYGWFGVGLLAGLIPIILIWSVAWKGWALWLAARRGSLIWFVVLLVLNTAGILEIVYIFFVAKRSDRPAEHHGGAN